MEDFKFLKFFGISAPMAVLMGPAQFKRLTSGIQSYVGGKILNSLRIELEIFKKFAVDGLEFEKVIDTSSEDYKNFIKGLKVYINSKKEPAAVTEEPVKFVQSSDRTDVFGGMGTGSATPEDSVGEVIDTDDPFGSMFEDTAPSGNDSDPFGDMFEDDPFGDIGLTTEDIPIPKFVQLGEEYAGEPEAVPQLSSPAKVILFFVRLSETAESFGLTGKDVEEIQKQYGELPVVFTGKVKNLQTGEILDLEKRGDHVYYILKTLQSKALVLYDGVPTIDMLITLAENAVEAASTNTRKFLGQKYNILCRSPGCTIEQRMMNSLNAESKEARLSRVNSYIYDCTELLSASKSQDRDLISEAGITSDNFESALHRLIESAGIEELQDEAQAHKFVAFIKTCRDNGQFKAVFSSAKAVHQLFAIYSEVSSWNNEKWMSMLDMMPTEDADRIGQSISTGVRTLYLVPTDFSIDVLCEELASEFNVIGVTTYSLAFYRNMLRVVGRVSAVDTYELQGENAMRVSQIVLSALIQLKSMQYRMTRPIPTFFAGGR